MDVQQCQAITIELKGFSRMLHHILHILVVETIVLLCVLILQYYDFENFDALVLNLY